MTTETNQEQAAPAVLEMSDEDFLNLNGPPEAAATTAAEGETDTTTQTAETVEGEEAAATAAEASAEAAGGEAADETKAGEGEAEATTEAKTEAGAEAKTEAKTEEKADATASGAEVKPDKAAAESETVNYEEAYKKVLAPFKANGKTIEPRNIDEVVQLMQMGANYTRKLQELQPHRKIVTMLSNNGLLDEGKLSFLIDLDKKNPEAIKKLVKDSGIDVLDIDPNVEPAYKPGSHAVSDSEVNFRSATEELVSTPSGRETIAEINDRWDDTSKEALWNKPEIMATIHEQRSNGVYAQITAEMDRQITLGRIPANTPFLEAYTSVGDAMVEAAKKAAAGQGGEQPGQTQEMSGSAPQLVATRAAAPKPVLANGDKAKAASPTRTSSKKAEVLKNPLAESDDEFLNRMQGRV